MSGTPKPAAAWAKSASEAEAISSKAAPLPGIILAELRKFAQVHPRAQSALIKFFAGEITENELAAGLAPHVEALGSVYEMAKLRSAPADDSKPHVGLLTQLEAALAGVEVAIERIIPVEQGGSAWPEGK